MDIATKNQNRKTTLAIFRRTPLMSSTEAATATGLSRSTAHRAIEFLRKKNLVLVSGKRSTGDASGKKPALLCLNANYRHILCIQIEIGGLNAGIADLKGRLLAETSTPFQPDSPLDAVLGHMKAAYKNMCAQLRLSSDDFAGMAVGCNGVVDLDNGILVSAPNFPSWGNAVPLVAKLRAIFKTMPSIFIDNSNRFDAYAEYRIGQAQGVRDFLVIDGHYDGFGGGLVVNGSLWRGRMSLAGEIGHLTVSTENGRPCYCGASGCLEAMASMRSLEEAAMAAAGKKRKSTLFSPPAPLSPTYRGIYDAANTGDKYAQSLVADQAKWLAVGINCITLIFAPEMVILQGKFVEGGAFLLQCVKERLGTLGLPRIADKVGVVYSHLGHDRCLIGQAHFVADAFFDTPDLYE